MSARKKKTSPKFPLAIVVVVILAGLFGLNMEQGGLSLPGTGGASSNATSAPEQFTYKVSPERTSQAKQELATLQIAPKGSMDGYRNNRDALFGDWRDGERKATIHGAGNGCDTRNDILARDMTEVKLAADGCTVESGTLWNPYGVESNPYNHYIQFTRGQGTSMAVQVDHIVALGNVWASGGDRLSEQDRMNIANDPINLVAVDGPANGSKGDRDASEWLPANDRIHCFYAASQIQVKARYNLTVTAQEKNALAQLIKTCPDGV